MIANKTHARSLMLAMRRHACHPKHEGLMMEGMTHEGGRASLERIGG